MKVGLVADPPSALLRRGLEALGHVVVFTAAHQAAIGPEQRAAIDLLIVAAPAAGPPVRPTLACLQLVLEVAFLERAATDFEAWKENLRRRIATARSATSSVRREPSAYGCSRHRPGARKRSRGF